MLFRDPKFLGYGDAGGPAASFVASPITAAPQPLDWHMVKISIVSGIAVWGVTHILDRIFFSRKGR